MVAGNKSNEISITRVYDAPVETVWEAWADPQQAAQWWGPRGFTLTTHSKDLRPGGIWHYTMHGPDGTDYPNKAFYHVVETHRKLVYDHGGYDDRPPLFRVTVLFFESAGKTTMEMTMALPTAEEAEATRRFIKAAGGNATWDRLAEYLDEKERGCHSFVINHSFAAPIEQVFEIWIQPGHLSRWLPPDGFNMDILRADFREGGDCFFRMSNRADVTFSGRFDYREITRPSRIVYVQRFCDESEQVTRHPGLPIFPEAMLVTVLLTAEDDSTTRVTVTSVPVETASAEEISAFRDTRSSMTQGWTVSFDQLEAIV
jgi:uncharacterized protein YndB with AHSA1/START domain